MTIKKEHSYTPSGVRSVTEEEVEFFFSNGWVHLPGLFSPELTAGLLAKAKTKMGADGDSASLRAGKDIDSTWFKDYHDPSREDELFAQAALAPVMGQNAARLLGRDAAMRFLTDLLAVKLPVSSSGRGAESDFHQDYNLLPFDRNSVNVWVALDTVEAAQGPLRFFSRSHTLGMLGKPGDYMDMWPRVRRVCSIDGPAILHPGDATVHGSQTIHGASENLSDRARWGYILSYFPADARYTCTPYRHTDGLGLEAFKTADHPKFPIVYTPSEES